MKNNPGKFRDIQPHDLGGDAITGQFYGWNDEQANRPQGYKTFSCSTQLSMKFFLLINVKMPTIVGVLTFMNRKNSILALSESEKS